MDGEYTPSTRGHEGMYGIAVTLLNHDYNWHHRID